MNLSKKTYPSLQEFQRAAYSAELTDDGVREIRDLYISLKRILSVNPRVMGHYITRTSGLSSYDWSIDSEDKNINTDDVLTRTSDTIISIIENHCKAPFFGKNLYQLNYDNISAGQRMNITAMISPEKYDVDYPNILFLDNMGKITNTINVNQSRDYVLDVVNQYMYKGGLLRTIMAIEIIRMDIVLENANFIKKLKGILQIINKGGGEEDEKNAVAAVQSVIKDNFVMTSEFIEFKLNEITGSGAAAFKDVLTKIDSDISIAILGQANTTDLPTGGGSRAALQVQALISADIFWSDMIRIENLINKQVLKKDYQLNYAANAEKAPYKFKFKVDAENDIEKNAATISILKGIVPLKKSEVYNFIGFTEPEAGDELF